MNGLELSRRFYEECGIPMLRDFADIAPKIAVALAGSGSECFGYDDELSRDHDFEPGFCLFLPDEDTVDRRSAFLLERAYAKLPREFMGFARAPLSPVGGNRHGVIRLADFPVRRDSGLQHMRNFAKRLLVIVRFRQHFSNLVIRIIYRQRTDALYAPTLNIRVCREPGRPYPAKRSNDILNRQIPVTLRQFPECL